MKLNKDRVPATHAEAVRMILDSLALDEVEQINAPGFSMVDVHHSVGRFIRNAWSLWQKDTVLVRHYADRHELGHADDISSIILEEVACRVQGRRFDMAAAIERCHAHWRAQGVHPVTLEPVGRPGDR